MAFGKSGSGVGGAGVEELGYTASARRVRVRVPRGVVWEGVELNNYRRNENRYLLLCGRENARVANAR